MLITARKQKARNYKNLEFLSKTRIPKLRILELKSRIPKKRNTPHPKENLEFLNQKF